MQQRSPACTSKATPLILFNIWDAGGAKVVADLGMKAIATGSWSVAAAHGYGDGEKLPFDLAIANLRRIVDTVELPVTFDMEGGYGRTPDEVAANIAAVINAGAVGINIEDQVVGGTGLYPVEEQAARIAAIRRVADAAGVPLFINARTDVFLKDPPDAHSGAHLEDALTRAAAYAEAGASGFFAPGLADAPRTRALCERSPLPVNIMFLPYAPSPRQLAELGVCRISYGATPYRQAMDFLKDAARAALALL